jgi:thiol-disulfide isomerase/thioredoxin
MKTLLFSLLAGIIFLLFSFISRYDDGHKTLEIGAAAPDFKLMGVDDKMYDLASFKKARVLVVIFTCNHCPTAQCYEDRIINLTADYVNKNVAVVAIMPNDPQSLRLDELDFSDLGDSFAEMKIRAKEKKFNFPYLYDGDTEAVSRAYGPVATPHVFVFDKERKLRYEGRFDDTESPFKTPGETDAKNAIDALLDNREVPVKTTKVFGCSVKWSEKKELVQKSLDAWAKEPVHLDTVDKEGLESVMKNPSGKLRLVNLWSISSRASMQEFPEFITINRMYRDRDFEFISISTDGTGERDKILKFLETQQASNSNFLINPGANPAWFQSVNPEWHGDLPYTLLIEPGGKIVFAKEGTVDPARLKKTIVNNHLIGRYP